MNFAVDIVDKLSLDGDKTLLLPLLLQLKSSSQQYSSENIDIKNELQQMSVEHDRLVYESRNLVFNHLHLQEDLENCERYESIYEKLEFSEGHGSVALPLEYLRQTTTTANELDPYFEYLYAELEKRKQELSVRAQVQDKVDEMKTYVLRQSRKMSLFDEGIERLSAVLQVESKHIADDVPESLDSTEPVLSDSPQPEPVDDMELN